MIMNKISIDFGSGNWDKERVDGINEVNLRRLGEYVRDNVSDEMFKMDLFYRELIGEDAELRGCSSIGCLLGYSPYALGKKLASKSALSFINYGRFSLDHYRIDIGGDMVGAFLFKSRWSEVDNSRIGALRRIRFVIDNDGYDYGQEDYSRWYGLYSPRRPNF